eukprot:1093962-Amphidinium_carterae.1
MGALLACFKNFLEANKANITDDAANLSFYRQVLQLRSCNRTSDRITPNTVETRLFSTACVACVLKSIGTMLWEPFI